MARFTLRVELALRVDGRIHVPPETRLRRRQRVCDLVESDVSDDQYVDVAAAREFAAGGGPEHEGETDSTCEGKEARPKHLDQAGRLFEDRAKLREDWGPALRPVVHLPPVSPARHETRANEGIEFSLDRPERGSGPPHDLPEVELLFRMAVQPAEDETAGFSEQNDARVGGGGAGGPLRTHFRHDCTHLENFGKEPEGWPDKPSRHRREHRLRTAVTRP